MKNFNKRYKSVRRIFLGGGRQFFEKKIENCADLFCKVGQFCFKLSEKFKKTLFRQKFSARQAILFFFFKKNTCRALFRKIDQELAAFSERPQI